MAIFLCHKRFKLRRVTAIEIQFFKELPLKNWIPSNNVILAYGTIGCFNETVFSGHFINLIELIFLIFFSHKSNMLLHEAPHRAKILYPMVE